MYFGFFDSPRYSLRGLVHDFLKRMEVESSEASVLMDREEFPLFVVEILYVSQ